MPEPATFPGSGTGPAALAGWFDRAAARHPDAVALVAGGVELTYQQLDAAAARTGDRIAAACGPGSAIGLIASRTAESYAGYLAVLRSGCTVVPLNPAFPPERSRRMLAGARAHGVLGPAEEIARLELPWSAIEPFDTPATALQLCPAPGSIPAAPPAYVLFTSGTTGTPKGIPISAANVCAFLEHVAPTRGIGPGDRASQCFDLTFDPSVFDMFTTWGSGACLVVPSREQLRNPVAFVREFDITHWSSVPSLISLAGRMRQLRAGTMPSLRSSCFAGEALTLSQAASWLTAAPNTRIVNAYGPTELTITCAAYQLPADPQDWPDTRNGTVPIGRPYPVVRWRIEPASETPDGTGELWLAGPQRFAGYLDPADNAGRFSRLRRHSQGWAEPDPQAYFRTGDNVEDTAEGLLHLGRLDQQVQVNGYRVELSEVEGALRTAPTVEDAVAFVQDGELVAVHTGTADDAGAILDLVGTRLPPYMVPSRLEHRAELPLNANGKIDRNLVACQRRAAPEPVSR